MQTIRVIQNDGRELSCPDTGTARTHARKQAGFSKAPVAVFVDGELIGQYVPQLTGTERFLMGVKWEPDHRARYSPEILATVNFYLGARAEGGS
jgi:hypothetical protein